MLDDLHGAPTSLVARQTLEGAVVVHLGLVPAVVAHGVEGHLAVLALDAVHTVSLVAVLQVRVPPSEGGGWVAVFAGVRLEGLGGLVLGSE